ncbi:hypothetical protein Pfo_019949 [Paulownia fortunei]|nr:hypothetical protein Pfo_019949 [Paulownia fortunei]
MEFYEGCLADRLSTRFEVFLVEFDPLNFGTTFKSQSFTNGIRYYRKPIISSVSTSLRKVAHAFSQCA